MDNVILLSSQAQQLWDRVNDTAADIPPATIGELFADRVRSDPQRHAVIAARRSLTYRELGALAAGAAELVARAGGKAVAVCVEPGWEQVVAVAAAALAGVPFHAIDPAAAQPARWRRLAELDSGVLLTQSWLDERLRWPEGTIRIPLDTAPDGRPPTAGPVPAGATAAPDDAVCLLTPRRLGGALLPVTHGAVVDVVTDLARRFDIDESDRVLAVSPLGDPAALYAIFAMLLAGGAVVVPDDIDLHTPPAWFELMRRERVTVWHATPTLSALLVEHLKGRGEAARHLRLALIGGEPLAPSLVGRLRAVAGGPLADPASDDGEARAGRARVSRRTLRVANLGDGGPAGLWATCMEVDEPDQSAGQVPIGAPLANRRVYVLSDAMAPCPVWVTGRVYVGGRGMPATGGDDFATLPGTGERLYRTDLTGRLLPDGVVEVVGDDAARTAVRGHPLNLREVEALLAAHPAVVSAAVVPHGDGCTAYAKLTGGARVTGAELLDHLRKRMSPYLLPARVDLVGTFALTGDGRIDRAALTELVRGAADAPPAEPVADAGAVPADLVERACRLAARVLGLSDVDEGMNLLDLGATSIQLVRIATQAEEELGIEVDVEELLRFPSVAVLVSFARPAEAAHTPAADAVAPARDVPARDAPPAAVLASDVPPADAPPAGGRPAGLIVDPVDRMVFKDRQLGIRHELARERSVPLVAGTAAGDLDERLRRRRTHREFGHEPVPAAAFASLLGALRRLDEDGRRHAYPSAGSAFPVQTYVTVAAGRVDGVPAGAYYHHPGEHRLVALDPGAVVDPAAHAWINRAAFRASAFSLYLVADLDAILPLYGIRSRDYSLIEAGAMCQLLMAVAAELGLGLCPVGDLDDGGLRGPLRLGDGHELLHTLIGGVPAAGGRDTEQEMLHRVGLLGQDGAGPRGAADR